MLPSYNDDLTASISALDSLVYSSRENSMLEVMNTLVNRVGTLEKVLVDILKDYPHLVLKYPDLLKSVDDNRKSI